MWSRWLPTDSMNTFETGGFYMIERKTLRLQIVVLNTNLMRRDDGDDDASRQWEWLHRVLHKCQLHKETVYLVGHMPPGSDERQRGSLAFAYTDYHNRRYIQLVRKYSDIIVGQFFGHLHSDSFRVIYNEGRAVSWAMLAPSVTPRRTSDGPNNPGIRLYKFDKDTGQVFDYTQYYLDLSSANKKGEAEWVVEYNFSSYYGITNITPLSLHNLAEKLTQCIPSDNPTFTRYYKANSVRIHNDSQIHLCDLSCAHNHYCAITRIDYHEHEDCLKTAASALASSAVSKINTIHIFVLSTNILWCIL
ncbi:acid sphingomyelinase-like phosphodiesterase 3a [Photinus pyralis]|nr:acid sphingomyelinase-like phosphodiesterase 3a [Photinus pyralis]